MNLSQFFDHWLIDENPFRGEEARHDAVFARMGFLGDEAGAPERATSSHSDFEKILGELTQPSTSIVFGEKGSGKTAIRMQIADRIGAHNRAKPDAKILLLPYDDLNTFLDQLQERACAGARARTRAKRSSGSAWSITSTRCSRSVSGVWSTRCCATGATRPRPTWATTWASGPGG